MIPVPAAQEKSTSFATDGNRGGGAGQIFSKPALKKPALRFVLLYFADNAVNSCIASRSLSIIDNISP